MIAYTLLECGVEPSFVVGGTVPQLGGGSRSGSGPVFVAEACEFDRSFHNLHPRVGVIMNIEEDHLDCYKNLEQIVESFRTFSQLVPEGRCDYRPAGRTTRVLAAAAGLKTPAELVAGDSRWIFLVNSANRY